MGIKFKIRLGFLAIGSLLLLSGIISSLELTRLNNTTYDLLVKSQNNIEFSKRMLDAVQEENTALLLSITDTMNVYDSIYTASAKDFSETLEKAEVAMNGSPELKAIALAEKNYRLVVAQLSDTVSIDWFSQVYKTSYFNLTQSIKDFMVVTQHQILEFTSALKEKAYRATMVAIISLGAGLFLLVLFYYMINTFYIAPVVRIKTSLKNYLNSRLPFDVKISSKDELMSLKEYIIQLIDLTKNK